MSNGWSEWADINEAAKKTGSFEDYGIYQVRIVNSESGPHQIHRLVGVDQFGLGYIGRSGMRATGNQRTVANRMREWQAIWHPGAALYNKAKTLLGDHRLEVRALFLPDDEIVAAETGGADRLPQDLRGTASFQFGGPWPLGLGPSARASHGHRLEPEEIALRIKRVLVTDSLYSPLQL
jgi:hypothetical protein